MAPFDETPTGPLAAPASPGGGAVGPQSGDLIGPYKLLQPLGEGGMGEVWMAEQTTPIQRRVALKLIQQGRDSKPVLARFEAERQALALMDHPNIAKVLGAGTVPADGRPYFVMELVKGLPITEFCDREQLTAQERIDLILPVCSAVQHAHQKGIIHRDLKPSNILVGVYDGKPVPKVIDFGVAKALFQRLTDRTMFTEVGAIVGTLEYMAPEQAELNNLDIDTRADIYALGVVLYELLTGSPPFTSRELRRAASDEMFRMIREVEPPRPSTRLSSSAELPAIAGRRKTDPRRLARDVQGDLDWITMKCLAKERSRRYETADALAADLRRYRNHEPVSAGPPRLAYRLKKWARRKPATAALVGVAFLLPILITSLLLWHTQRVQGMNDEIQKQSERVAAEAEAAKTAQQQYRLQRDIAQENERRAHRHLYAANLGLFPRLWDSGRPIGLYEMLDGTRPDRTGGAELRGWEWFYLHREIYRESVRFAGHATPVQTAAFSPDGSLVASTGFDGLVAIWDSKSSREVRRFRVSESPVLSLSFSPDGKHLAIAGEDGAAGVVELSSGRRALRLDGHLLAINHIAYSPDGQILATAGADNVIKLWNAETGRVTATLVGHRAGVGRLWFHRDGRTLASIGGEQVLRFWDVAAAKELPDRARPIRSSLCALNSDFSVLAYLANGERLLRLQSLDKPGEPINVIQYQQPGVDLAFSGDGRLLGVADSDGNTQVWDAQTHQLAVLYRGWAETVAFSPDGDRIASACADRAVKIWPTKDGSLPNLAGHVGWAKCAAVSPSGDRIATGDAVGSIRLWNAGTGQFIRALGIHIADRGPAGSPPNPARAAMKDRPLRNKIVFKPPASGKVGPETVREVYVYQGHSAEIHTLAFSPDGRTLASAGGDPNVHLWDLTDADAEPRILKHPQRTPALAFSPDGARLVTGSWDDAVRVWNVKTGDEEIVLRGHNDNVDAVLFQPDGERVISAGIDGAIRIWDRQKGRTVQVLEGHAGAVHCLALSPDGQTLASGSADETIRTWDLQSGKPRSILHGHTSAVTGLLFLPERERLISTSDSEADGRIRVWDVEIGREVVSLSPPYQAVYGMAYDPVRRRMVLSAARQFVVWEATDPGAEGRSQRPAPPSASDEVLFPADSGPRLLGHQRVKELPSLHMEAKSTIKPAKPDNEFLVVFLSMPYERLYPTPAEHEALQHKRRKDPEENPAGPVRSYALFSPRRFRLAGPDGDRPALAIAPHSSFVRVGYNRGTTVESTTRTLKPRERVLIRVAWEIPATKPAGPFRLRLDGGAEMVVPDLRLDGYQGNPAAGSTARRAGAWRGEMRLVEQRNYSEFE